MLWLSKNILFLFPFQCLSCSCQIIHISLSFVQKALINWYSPKNIGYWWQLLNLQAFVCICPRLIFSKECDQLFWFVFHLYSIGSRTDSVNQEKKNIWRLGTSAARQTSLGFLSEELCFLRDTRIRPSPPQTSGNTLNVYEPPTQRWKTTWKFYHTVDQSEQTTITRQSSQTSWEAVHRY